ncbi:MAG: biotin--[acetyl-CoA-carboxylase] ligase, partial [Terriglobales bacterium]
MSADFVQHFGAALHYYDSVDSTQQAARAAVHAGAPEGSVFVAEQQTAGRGRHGHHWVSPPGAGIYASLVLRPRRPVNKLLWLSLAAGLGVADGVEQCCGVHSELRWPNDLLLGGRKFCGLLLEAETEAAVLGFGINVRRTALPSELSAIATCLDEHTAVRCDRALLCRAVVDALLRRYAAWNGGDDEAVRREFECRSRYARGLP